jgi:hypothetical protein
MTFGTLQTRPRRVRPLNPAVRIFDCMHRFILIVLMFLVPFQWTWAAAANVCQHETGGAHFGHHEHQHEASSPGSVLDTEENDARALSVHPDCKVCHGVGAGHAPARSDAHHAWHRERLVPAYRHHLPDPPVEPFLRPPLHLVA